MPAGKRNQMKPTSDTISEVRTIRVLGVLFSLTGVLANPWLLVRFKPNGEIGFGLVLLILLFDLLMVFLGCSFLLSRRKVTIFRSVLGTLSLGFWILALLGSSELYLATKPDPEDTYQPFHVQYLHPFYFFSLPSDTGVLARINNKVVSVTPEGFRGLGPEQKGNRKLAFVIGGSAAFGDDASSDQTTISGYLNGLQQDYYFVNAGVPSWNSTQEFYRVGMQLLQYKPDLIVVYDGYNDASINHGNREQGSPFPPGTPESYNDIARWVDNIRAQPDAPLIKFNFSHLYVLTFPRTRDYLGEKLGKGGVGTAKSPVIIPMSRDWIESDAASYLWNAGNMQRLAAARGTRLVIFSQPTSLLQFTVTDADREKLGVDDNGLEPYMRQFHQYVLEHREPQLQFYDLSDLFDRFYGKIPLTDLFTDPVHLTDQGNQIVATEIWSKLSAPVAH